MRDNKKSKRKESHECGALALCIERRNIKQVNNDRFKVVADIKAQSRVDFWSRRPKRSQNK